MSKKILFLITILFIIPVLFSCAKKQECKLGGLNLQIINLEANENDTIQIFSFVKNSSFQELINTKSLVFIDSLDSINQIQNNSIYLNNGTTGFHSSDKNSPGFLSYLYDYKIITKHHEYYFTDFSISKKTKKCGGLLSFECPDCYSPVVLFKMNNVLFQVAENDFFTIEN